MKLYKNSFSAKLYQYFYSVNDWQMPKSLCPYFWKLVIAYLLFIPLEILAMPFNICVVIYNVIKQEKAFKGMFDCDIPPIGKVLIVALFCSLLTGLFYAFIPLINLFHPVSKEVLIGGYVTDFFALIIGIVAFFVWYKDNDNLMKDYISAKIKGICPRIEWTNDNRKAPFDNLD